MSEQSAVSRPIWYIIGIVVALCMSVFSCIICIVVLSLSIGVGLKVHDNIEFQKEQQVPPQNAIPLPHLIEEEPKPIELLKDRPKDRPGTENRKKQLLIKDTPKDAQPKLN